MAVLEVGNTRDVVSGLDIRPIKGWLSLKLRDRHGHALTYVGLFLFTAVLYFRPHEIFPALSSFSIPFVLALCTLLVFVPTQLMLEGRLTARPYEVHLVLLLCVTALLSIPLAINPAEAWEAFNASYIKIVLMFIVMVNVARTESRLKGLLILALAISCALSVSALNNYRLGNFTVEGYRVEGTFGGMFDNVNDMALFLVTTAPIAIALLIGTRGSVQKTLYGVCAALFVAAIVVSYSRGAFLGLIFALGTLAWKLGRRKPLAIVALAVCFMVAFVALAPGNYTDRVASIVDPSLDPNGSSSERRALLHKSVVVAIRNPLFGIGMGNFHHVSIRDLGTHNAYTQVAAEMGLAALVVYLLFIIVPFRRLRQIEQETYMVPPYSRIYYLAVGLQASLVGYMVASFFLHVAFYFFLYYLVGYAVCLRRIYETGPGRVLGRVALTIPQAQPHNSNSEK